LRQLVDVSAVLVRLTIPPARRSSRDERVPPPPDAVLARARLPSRRVLERAVPEVGEAEIAT
jgi:hypothetical protein